MFQLVATLQPLVVGAVLIWAARLKLFSRFAGETARRSALVSLIGQERALPAYRLLGGVELVVGALLILPPVLRVEAVAATGLAVGFLAYLGYAKVAAPDSSCGCLSAKRAPVTWRALVRAGMLVLASVLAIPAGAGWMATLTARPVAGTALLLAEAGLIGALSAELDAYWLLPLRQLRAHLTHPLRGGSGVPLLHSVQQLQLSEAYRRVSALLTSDVREHWDEGDWRMVCHAARYQGRPATAVFAVPLHTAASGRSEAEPAVKRPEFSGNNARDTVRVALIDDATGSTVWSFAGVPAEEERPVEAASGSLALGTR